MSGWFVNIYRHFRVRKARGISETERDTCERYGEHVIGTMLAGGLTPSTDDLRALYQTEEARQHARDWLTEQTDYQTRHDRWIESRDLFLELVIIGLIIWEIHLSYEQERQQSANFTEQQRVLSNMLTSSQTTADTLRTLSNDQKTSLDRQNETNKNLQNTLQETSAMVTSLRQQLKVQQESLKRSEETNAVVADQLKILKTEQAERIAEQNRRPELELWVQTFGEAGYSAFKISSQTRCPVSALPVCQVPVWWA
jgi:hypothetical protein